MDLQLWSMQDLKNITNKFKNLQNDNQIKADEKKA